MRHIFVINPAAGKGRHLENTCAEIRQAAEQAGIRPEIYVTRAAGDGERFAREAASGGEPVRLYACGGDGTLNELLNGVYGFENAELASVPVGSGNDFVKNFSEPEAFLDLDRQLRGRARPVDVILCGGRCCLNLANIGFDSDVCRRMAGLKKLPLVSGKGAYNLAVAATFVRKIGQRLRAVFPDGEVSDAVRVLTAVGNGVCYGGGYYAAPEASLTDGLMDVVMVRKMSRLRIVRLIGEYKAGNHLTHPGFKPYLLFRRVPSLRIESDRPIDLCVDGEILRQESTVEFRIGEKKLPFVLPEGVTLCREAREAGTDADARSLPLREELTAAVGR